MRFWLSEKAPPDVDYSDDNGNLVRLTPQYLELSTPLSHCLTSADPVRTASYDGSYVVLNWLRINEQLWVVGSIWEHHFDFFSYLLQYPATAKGARRAFTEGCPTFMALLARSEVPTNYDVALFQMNDPDDNERVWMLGAFFGNVEVTEAIDVLFQEQSLNALEKARKLAFDVLLETIHGPLAVPNLPDYIGSESMKDEIRSLVKTAPKVFEGLSTFAKLFGS